MTQKCVGMGEYYEKSSGFSTFFRFRYFSFQKRDILLIGGMLTNNSYHELFVCLGGGVCGGIFGYKDINVT